MSNDDTFGATMTSLPSASRVADRTVCRVEVEPSNIAPLEPSVVEGGWKNWGMPHIRGARVWRDDSLTSGGAEESSWTAPGMVGGVSSKKYISEKNTEMRACNVSASSIRGGHCDSGVDLEAGSGVDLEGGSGVDLEGGSGVDLAGVDLEGDSGVDLEGDSGVDFGPGVYVFTSPPKAIVARTILSRDEPLVIIEARKQPRE